LDAGQFNFSRLWGFITQSLNQGIVKEGFDFIFGNRALNVLANCQKRNPPEAIQLANVDVDKWIKWAKSNEDEKLFSHKFIRPNEKIVSDIAGKITAGTPIPDGLYSLIAYIIRCGGKEWMSIIDPIKSHINFNNGASKNNSPSLEVLRILVLLSALDNKILKLIRPIIQGFQFYILASHFKADGSIKYSAFLMAKCLSKEEFYSLSFPNMPPAANQGVTESRRFWQEKQQDPARIKFIWDILKFDSNYTFIWDLAENKENKLVAEIIKIAVDKDHAEFFNYKNALKLFSSAIKILMGGEDHILIERLVKCFIVHSQIEKEILDDKNLNIEDFSEEIFLLASKSENNEIFVHISKILESISKPGWDKAFADDSYLMSSAILMNEKSASFGLENHYYEALESFLKLWMSGKGKLSDWQKDNMPKLISVLKESFRTYLDNSLTNYLIYIEFKGDCEAIIKLLGYLNIQRLFDSGKDRLQESIHEFIKSKNFDGLNMINVLLTYDEKIMFEAESHFPDIIRQPLIDMRINVNDSKQIQLIEELSLKLKIDLKLKDKVLPSMAEIAK
jgi:hypothetical protein